VFPGFCRFPLPLSLLCHRPFLAEKKANRDAAEDAQQRRDLERIHHEKLVRSAGGGGFGLPKPPHAHASPATAELAGSYGARHTWAPPRSAWTAELGGVCAATVHLNERPSVAYFQAPRKPTITFDEARDSSMTIDPRQRASSVLASISDAAQGEEEAAMRSLGGDNDGGGGGGGRPPPRDSGAAMSSLGSSRSIGFSFQDSARGSDNDEAAGGDGDEVGGTSEWYTLGIIDILQEFNARKEFEGFIKGRVFGNEDVSAVHPGLYSDRFQDFVKMHTV
jgi:hypothetical protein